METGDSIAAIATPPGRGGVGIIRVSGSLSFVIAKEIAGLVPAPRHAYFCDFKDSTSEVIDQGICLFFKGPHSYTGEDVLELQGHGGPVVLDIVLRRILELGCRVARPGEFTERAFLNEKLDLAQAEAVSDLIESGSEHAARAAMLSLQGEFSDQINDLLIQLIELRVYIESALDFAEEEIDFLKSDELEERSRIVKSTFSMISSKAQQGKLLKEGMRVVIAGEPNVGKSSLLNALSGSETAIVTDIPGTTRDILTEQIHLDGMPLHIIDTAGLRESNDPVEIEGIKRAHEQIKKADRVIVVSTEGSLESSRPEWVDSETPVDFVVNKIDLNNKSPYTETLEYGVRIHLSAKSGNGLDLLKTHLKESMGFDSSTEGAFIARRRHLDALKRAETSVDKAIDHLGKHAAGELCAEELRYAQDAINEITGEFTSDDLLGKIFSSFCIGK